MKEQQLFIEGKNRADSPLAVRLRPCSLNDFIGQEHILGKGKLLRRVIESEQIPPLILYGPAGCGKTTLGFIIASRIQARLHYLNAAFSSVKEVKSILEQARKRLVEQNQKTILFIDEVHRFNKLQQEALVPDTEQGTVIFIGATIYTPNYYLIPSIVSRSIIARFKPLSTEDITRIMKRALEDKEKGLGNVLVQINDQALDYIAVHASGDARKALASLELGVRTTPANNKNEIIFDLEVARETIQKNVFYDKKDGYHYDTVSAFIKSMRGSDPDSALYWLAKMINSGEDPRFIARRLVILASEDIGNASPFCLVLATSCFHAVELVGMPEAALILAQTAIYLACSPKSNAACTAISKASEDVEHQQTREVPGHIKTHSPDYRYPHAFGGWVAQEYGAPRQYYFPGEAGQEKKLKAFLSALRVKSGRNT